MLAGAKRIGEARSPTCGSTIQMSVKLDALGAIAALGLRAHACAVGQASAAVFARHAIGRNQAELEVAGREIAAWLAGTAPRPDWPGLEALDPARDYPARHGAMLLPWKAALAALSSTDAAS